MFAFAEADIPSSLQAIPARAELPGGGRGRGGGD